MTLRVLVTGGIGFRGSHRLSEALLESVPLVDGSPELFGSYDFDLSVIERVAERHLAREYRLDLLDEVVSDATFSLLQLPPGKRIEDPLGYAAVATRRQVMKTLRSDKQRREREEQWVDYCRLIRGVAEDRGGVECLIDNFLQAVESELTGRQREICRLTLEGWSRKEIAAQLRVDRKTVYNDLKRLYGLLRDFCDDFDPDDPNPPSGPSRHSREKRGQTCATSGVAPSEGSTLISIAEYACELGSIYRTSDMGSWHGAHPRPSVPQILLEFRYQLLNLPAFRGLPFAEGEPIGGSTMNCGIRCDSLLEITKCLSTASRVFISDSVGVDVN